MDSVISEHLGGIKIGEKKAFKNVAVFPLFSDTEKGPAYLTMKEAMEGGFLLVTEVSVGGAVPELKVVNRAEIPVLLLDGEELAGAKQNRVLNTTILLKKNSETVIPVSCTEQGRWAYASPEFRESGHIMSTRLRSEKVQHVHRSLDTRRLYQSDQGAIWNSLRQEALECRVESPTGAMKDVHEAKQADLDAYLEQFPCMAGQKGLLVIIEGEVAGFDIVSLDKAYEVLHAKLVKSYLMDAITARPRKGKEADANDASRFLMDVLECTEKKYESIGHGLDYRFEGRNVVGSALVHDGTVIHAAFFRASEAEKAGNMSGFSRRRNYRT